MTRALPDLTDGPLIAVVAPSSVYDESRFRQGLRVAQSRGWNVQPVVDILRPHGRLAGTDTHRRDTLLQALHDDRVAAVWAARGGHGATRLLRDVVDRVRGTKPLIGFSDITALHAALYCAGWPHLVHAPVIHSLPQTDDASLEALSALLRGQAPGPMVGRVVVEGQANAPVVGGNLCVFAALCGTPWQVDAAGCVLLLEDVGEPAYRVDRALQQLRNAGVFDGVAAVGFGQFVGCDARDDRSLDDIVAEHTAHLGVPVIVDLPFGHGPENHPFVWGRPAHLFGGRIDLS